MKTLIAYFSALGTTKKIADEVAKECGLDVFEIVPADLYTKEDLDYTNPAARCNQENQSGCDVPVAGKVENFAEYDRVFVGFPIWYGCAPNVVNTFCKSYDFTGKKVVAFATSATSPIGKTAEKLEQYVCGASGVCAALVHNADELKALL